MSSKLNNFLIKSFKNVFDKIGYVRNSQIYYQWTRRLKPTGKVQFVRSYQKFVPLLLSMVPSPNHFPIH